MLQPTASLRVVNLLTQLTDALQKQMAADNFFAYGQYNEKLHKRTEKLFKKPWSGGTTTPKSCLRIWRETLKGWQA